MMFSVLEKTKLVVIATALLLGIIVSAYNQTPLQDKTTPNVLFIMCDQFRWDKLGIMGDTLVKTPNLDQLAREGVLFTNAYTPSPRCSPARASLISGMYPPANGVVNNWVGFKERVENDLLTHKLKELGYYTGLVGKLHLMPAHLSFGFDNKQLHDAPYSKFADDDKNSAYIKWLKEEYYNEKGIDPVTLFDEDENAVGKDMYRFYLGSNFRTEEEHDVPWTVMASQNFMKNRNPEKPFFLFTSFFGPHHPFHAPYPYDTTMYPPESIKLPERFGAEMDNNPIFEQKKARASASAKNEFTEHQYKILLSAYYGQVIMIDHYLGKLIDYMKQEGVWDNTLVVFTADHGDFNADYGLFQKGEMYEASVKVPLIIKPPQSKRNLRVRDQVVNSLDTYGTILEYAGADHWKEENIEAKSLVPLLSGKKKPAWNNKTYSILGQNPFKDLTMLREDNFKLIRYSQGKKEALYELYDMSDSLPEVSNNLFNNPEYAPTKAAMKADLDAWWARQAPKYPDNPVSYRKKK